MKNLTLLSILLWAAASAGLAQQNCRWSVVAQQANLFYSSRQITSAGTGFGAGAGFTYRDWWMAQADANLYWLNGNAWSLRLAIGIRRPGKWSPAVMAGGALVGGARTEIITGDGARPAFPVFVPEIRFAPLRFQNERGQVSILECGAGLGPDKGILGQLSIISLGLALNPGKQ